MPYSPPVSHFPLPPRPPPPPPRFPYTTLFRSHNSQEAQPQQHPGTAGLLLFHGDMGILEPGFSDTGRPVKSHGQDRSEEHTSELQSRGHLVCRLLLEKKNSAIIAHQLPRDDEA